MVVRQTSIISYEKVMENGQISPIYRKILEILADSYCFSDLEMTKKLGFSDPNQIRPRRFELMKKGLVEIIGKRPDRYTKRTVSIWNITSKGLKKLKMEKGWCV